MSRQHYHCTAQDLATANPETRSASTAVSTTRQWLRANGYDVAPVVEDGTPIGYVDLTDLTDAPSDDPPLRSHLTARGAIQATHRDARPRLDGDRRDRRRRRRQHRGSTSGGQGGESRAVEDPLRAVFDARQGRRRCRGLLGRLWVLECPPSREPTRRPLRVAKRRRPLESGARNHERRAPRSGPDDRDAPADVSNPRGLSCGTR